MEGMANGTFCWLVTQKTELNYSIGAQEYIVWPFCGKEHELSHEIWFSKLYVQQSDILVLLNFRVSSADLES